MPRDPRQHIRWQEPEAPAPRERPAQASIGGDPFLGPNGAGAVDAQSRINHVQRFDADQCRRALEVEGLQKTVEQKIHARLRQLEREARA